MFQIRPVNLYKRDRELFKKIAKGELNSRNILEIEYGEFPMKGIDIQNVNERPVHVRNYFQDKNSGRWGKFFYSLLTLGYVHGKPISASGTVIKEKGKSSEAEYDRAIYLNKLFYSPLGQYFVGTSFHLPLAKAAYSAGIAAQALNGVAGLAMAAPAMLKAAAIKTATYLNSHWLILGAVLSSARMASAVQILTLPFRATMDTVGHEHVHVLQVHDENKTGFLPTQSKMCEEIRNELRFPLSVVSEADTFASFFVVPYLRNDCEIQARMHTVLAEGYREKWHQLPVTRHELWGALISSGLNAPAEVRHELDQSTEQGLSRFYQKGPRGAFNRVAQKCTNPHVAELNAAHASLLAPSLKEKYWREVVPYLYGHLVELYGDPQGRSRMEIAAEKSKGVDDILSRLTGRLVKMDEVSKKADEIEGAELTGREKLLLKLLERPVSVVVVLAGLLFGKELFPKNAHYVDSNKNDYFEDSFLKKEAERKGFSLTPKLTRKVNAIFARAVDQVADYREDLRQGKVKVDGLRPR